MKDYFASISAAIDDEARLKSLKARYGHYVSIPFLSGFNKSVSFIRNEMGATR
jgi:phosphohistidine swiveling domain-containing protein